jgi:hypothetical protein
MEVPVHKLPINEVPECVEVFSSSIPVVDVIGMLPDINCQQRLETTGEGVARIAGVHDRQIGALLGQPGPA